MAQTSSKSKQTKRERFKKNHPEGVKAFAKAKKEIRLERLRIKREKYIKKLEDKKNEIKK